MCCFQTLFSCIWNIKGIQLLLNQHWYVIMIQATNISYLVVIYSCKCVFQAILYIQDFAVTSKATLLHHNILLDATVDFDVFSKKNQKVILTAKLVRNQVSNGFNVTGFISIKGKVSGHGSKRMIYLCFNLYFPSRSNLNSTLFNQLTF